jgi:hypothetical protein
MDAATFRADFPVFANPAIFPDSQINFQIDLAVIRLPECRWTTLLPYGIELFVAHNLSLARAAQIAAAAGAAPGALNGPVTSKAVDKVSYSMDPSLVALTDGGYWNLTSFGVEFLQLARMIGAGPIQL